MKLLTVSIIVTLIPFYTIAQNSPEDLLAKFFSEFENQSSNVAVDNLYGTNPWTIRIQDQIDNVKTQLARYNVDLVGKYYGYEKITSKKLGDSYVLYSYFLKFDRQFIRLIFQFYKPDNEWRLYSFSFDSDYDDELKESAKIYFLTDEK